MKNISFISLLILTVLPLRANPDLVSMLPDPSDYPSLTIIQEPAVYVGDELFTMIDGGAEIYFEYGFRQALSVAYLLGNNNRIELFLYEMEDAHAAFGIHTHSRSDMDSLYNDSACLILSNPAYIMFRKGAYFGVLSWTGKAEDESIYFSLIDAIAIKITAETDYPALVNKALNAGIGMKQLKYIQGKIALSSIYFFSHNDLFSIEDALAIEKDNARYIVFSYNPPDKALAQLEKIKAEYAASARVTELTLEEMQVGFTDRKGRRVTFRSEQGILFVCIAPQENKPDWQWLIARFR